MKFKNIKEGDRLWHILWGWGTVVKIEEDEVFPIYFEADVDAFTMVDYEGKSNKSFKYPVLFYNEVKLPSEEEDLPPFELKKHRSLERIKNVIQILIDELAKATDDFIEILKKCFEITFLGAGIVIFIAFAIKFVKIVAGKF